MKGWKLITLAVALGVVLAFAGVAIAQGAAGDRPGGLRGMMGGWMMADGQGGAAPGACGGAGAELMGNADFRADMQKLREQHREDMQAWWDKFGPDTSSAAAQKALQELRTEHWTEMRTLFKKYGVELPQEAPAGRGPFGAGRGCGSAGAGGCAGPGAGAGQGLNATGMMGGGMMGAGSL